MLCKVLCMAHRGHITIGVVKNWPTILGDPIKTPLCARTRPGISPMLETLGWIRLYSETLQHDYRETASLNLLEEKPFEMPELDQWWAKNVIPMFGSIQAQCQSIMVFVRKLLKNRHPAMSATTTRGQSWCDEPPPDDTSISCRRGLVAGLKRAPAGMAWRILLNCP